MMKKTFLNTLLLLSVVSYSPLLGQMDTNVVRIWPGDINHNGIVNEVDILYWGVAYGSIGPERPAGEASLYTGQPIGPLWDDYFPDSTNYAFADCNGDGLVDQTDLDSAIAVYFNRKNSNVIKPDRIQLGEEGEDPGLILVSETEIVEGGDKVHFDVELGAGARTVKKFYGIAFQLHYPPEFVRGWKDLRVDDDDWVVRNDAEQEVELFTYDDRDRGVLYVALVRKDQRTRSGSGPIMSGTIVIEDIIFDIARDTFQVAIDSVRMITATLKTIPAAASAYQLAKSAVVATTANAPKSTLKVYPNPGKETVYLQLPHPEETIRNVRITDLRGRMVQNVTFGTRHPSYRMSVSNLSTGMYFIAAETDKQIYTSKIIVR